MSQDVKWDLSHVSHNLSQSFKTEGNKRCFYFLKEDYKELPDTLHLFSQGGRPGLSTFTSIQRIILILSKIVLCFLPQLAMDLLLLTPIPQQGKEQLPRKKQILEVPVRTDRWLNPLVDICSTLTITGFNRVPPPEKGEIVMFPPEFGDRFEARYQITFLAWRILYAGEYLDHPMITEQEEKAAVGQAKKMYKFPDDKVDTKENHKSETLVSFTRWKSVKIASSGRKFTKYPAESTSPMLEDRTMGWNVQGLRRTHIWFKSASQRTWNEEKMIRAA